MIILLDDISRFMYKKLKADEDSLVRIRLAIEYKKKLADVHEKMWFKFLECNPIDADSVYRQKYLLDVEIIKLEREEAFIIGRIKRLCW